LDSEKVAINGGTIKNAAGTVNALTVDVDGKVGVPQGVLGVTDGSDAAAGCVGEVLSVSVGPVVNGSPNTSVEVCRLTLTPGDWDVTGYATLEGSAATLTGLRWAINTSLTVLSAASANVQYVPAIASAGRYYGGAVIPARFSVSAPTVVYMAMLASFSGANMNMFGGMIARRAR
jgi:hypothetical protein